VTLIGYNNSPSGLSTAPFTPGHFVVEEVEIQQDVREFRNHLGEVIAVSHGGPWEELSLLPGEMREPVNYDYSPEGFLLGHEEKKPRRRTGKRKFKL